jgi:peptide/nickel transport system substrate-binding protein
MLIMSDEHATSVGDAFTRRQALVRAGQLGVGVAATGGLLAACGSTSSNPSATTSTSGSQPWDTTGAVAELPGGTPVRGGTLKLAVVTGGNTETLVAPLVVQYGDYARAYMLYSWLFYMNQAANEVVPGLALSAESNAKATLWTLHLRPGVYWHDGSPFTADDVIWTFKNWSQPSAYVYGTFHGLVDFPNLRKRDKLTVEIPLLSGFAAFPSLLVYENNGVIKSGMSDKDIARTPIGTGPFVYKEFKPGSYSRFTKNPHYWESGKPYVDAIVVDSSFSDPTALFNALQSGQVDMVSNLDFALARGQVASKNVAVLAGPPYQQSMTFNMRLDQAPFKDVRVRQAFKLLVNRAAMIEGALSGFGAVANDVPGYGIQYFDSSLKRHQDVEQARSLFKAAGVKGHTFTLQTSSVQPGFVQSATLLQEQAVQAGVKVKLLTLAPSAYWLTNGTSTAWLTRTFGQNYLSPIPSLAFEWRGLFIPNATTNDTHWGEVASKAELDLMYKAFGETNPSVAAPMWHELQAQQFNQGGYVLWGTFPYVDAASTKVRGLKAGGYMNFNSYRMQDGWLAA